MTEERQKTPKRVGRGFSFRTAGIALAFPVIGIAVIISLHAVPEEGSRFAISDSGPMAAQRPIDPLASELARCRTVAADRVDARCRAAWEVHRRRFFGKSNDAMPLPEQPVIPPPAVEER